MEITEKSLSSEQFGKVAACHVVPGTSTNTYPIVFVHGAWGGKYQFEDWQQYSADHGWESYAVDLPGHYQSPCNDLGTISIRDYVNAIEQVAQQIGPCYLLGHSMGGLIVQLVASRCAQVKKTVLLASVPPAGIYPINAFLVSMLKYLPSMVFQRPLQLNRPDASRFILNRLNPDSYESWIPEAGRALADAAFQRIWIKGIECPTLVVGAQNDRAVPISALKRTAQKYHSAYILIPNMGHMMMLEKEWERPIQEILQWLI